MRKAITVFVVGILGFLTVEANAIPVTFTDTTLFSATDAYDSIAGSSDLNAARDSDSVNFLQTTSSQAEAWNYDFVSWTHHFGFDPALDYITSAKLEIGITDDSDVRREFAFGITEAGILGVGEVDTALYNFDVATSVLADGMFGIAVVSLLGDFYIGYSSLTISYEPISSVAEPSTVAILGMGLIVLGLIQISQRRT